MSQTANEIGAQIVADISMETADKLNSDKTYAFQISAEMMLQELRKTSSNILSIAHAVDSEIEKIASQLKQGIDKRADDLRDLENRLGTLREGVQKLAAEFHNGAVVK